MSTLLPTRARHRTASTVLPVHGRHHRHSTETHRRIAEQGTILRTEVGSGLHGTSISGQDDRDEMGVCLEPRAYVTGTRLINQPDGPATRFEQYEYHSAWERPGGLANRSGAGDLDVTIYGARKYLRLVMDGNPTVLMPLFAPGSAIVHCNEAGHELRANADRLASKRAAGRFLGYLDSQKKAMLGERKARTNRPELKSVHGYDTKFAMHACRLGVQGVEYLQTGRITLPVPLPARNDLREIRAGHVALGEVIEWLTLLEEQLRTLRQESPLPDEPDYEWVDAWLHNTYLAHWGHYRSNADLSSLQWWV